MKKNKKNNISEEDFFSKLDNVEKKATSSIKTISIIFVVILFLILLAIGGLYTYIVMPVNIEDESKVTFVVNQGDTVYGVIDRLSKEHLVKNAKLVKLYVKYNGINNFYAGEYELSKSYPLDMTLGILTGITNAKQDTLNIQFVEGKRIPYYAKVIANKFDYSEEEVINTMNDKEFLNELVNKYWFITDDILNENLYYPLEGYLFPDTYQFNKDTSIKDIIETMIKKMDSVLSEYKQEIEGSSRSVHSLLTVASMVELEAVSAEDRALTAGVFYNRLEKGWTLGSDVTTYYDVKKDLVEGLTYKDLNTCNGYNTRGSSCQKGLPIGPIACVSKSSILAAIRPTETKYMYFVADKNNKLYFAETQSGHDQNIRDLKSKNLWPE
ncbi:MAG: endolytic transglycosylase MltG [Bacilli bacterium]|nr:endolytic transglycosylase MltG [Bacilli bacterium]